MVVEAIKSEYNRYKTLTELAIAQVREEDLSKILGEDGNSISIVMNHLIGNLKSRFTNFLTEDGEKPWRNRDGEFEEKNSSKEELLKGWNESFEILFNQLDLLNDSDLSKEVKIREQKLSVAEALARSLSHCSYHVGQIVLIARFHVGKDWKSLSIPKGKSQAYNADPVKEKKPN